MIVTTHTREILTLFAVGFCKERALRVYKDYSSKINPADEMDGAMEALQEEMEAGIDEAEPDINSFTDDRAEEIVRGALPSLEELAALARIGHGITRMNYRPEILREVGIDTLRIMLEPKIELVEEIADRNERAENTVSRMLELKEASWTKYFLLLLRNGIFALIGK